MDGFQFTQNWFGTHVPSWERLWPIMKPRRVLEIGSYEGTSTCWMIDKLGQSEGAELACVDRWEDEFTAEKLNAVEQRWEHNVRLAGTRVPHPPTITKYRGPSDLMLATLLAQGKANTFDLAYIDASHHAPDVLCDAVLTFRLVRVGGFLIFDDYTWDPSETPGGASAIVKVRDPLQSPKAAIDVFANLHYRRARVLQGFPNNQVYMQKLSD